MSSIFSSFIEEFIVLRMVENNLKIFVDSETFTVKISVCLIL